MDQAKRLKALEKENVRLKQLVAEQALEIAILPARQMAGGKEAASGNF